MDAVDGPPKVDLDLLLPLFPGLLHEQPVYGPAHVVHQNIHATELGDGFGDHFVDLFGVGDIAGNHLDPASRVHLAYLSGNYLALARGELGDGDVASFGGEGVNDGTADVRPASSDDNVLFFQA